MLRGAPLGPAGGASTSLAVARIPPVAPASGAIPGTAGSGPLGRSGVDLLDVLDTADVHVARAGAAPVAVEVGLEGARAALLRGLPVDALVTLDSVWAGAKRTEEGWYLRGGALFALGLPGEGDRLAQAGLALRSSSAALRFLQSLARLALGDAVGARATLALALQQRPAHPLLLAQDAVVRALQGDREGADAALRALSRHASPDDPVLSYARDAVRTALAHRMRGTGEGIPLDGGPEGPHRAGLAVPLSELLQSVDGDVPATADPLAAAMHKLGARMALLPAPDVALEVRMLLRALSSGGVLAGSCRPETAHAARGLLTTVLTAMHGAGTVWPTSRAITDEARVDRNGDLTGEDVGGTPAGAHRGLLHDLVSALRAGRADDAMRLLRRHQGGARDATGPLLEALVRGAVRAVQLSHAEDRIAAVAGHDSLATRSAALVQDDLRGPVVPLRLGLRLLMESAAERAVNVAAGEVMLSDDGDVRRAATSSRPDSYVGGTQLGVAGWYGLDDAPVPPLPMHASMMIANLMTPYAAASSQGHRRGHGTGSPNASAMAIVLVILAAGAAATGHAALAVAFGVGASWVAMRRIGADRAAGRVGDTDTDFRDEGTDDPRAPADDTGHRR